MDIREIDVDALAVARESATPPLLVDVLPADAHRELRIPGSVNACIYEVTFLRRMEEIAPDRGAPVVVYGSGPGSRDARDAADRLLRAGYRDVRVFAGGRRAWVDAGRPVEGEAEEWKPVPPPPRPDGTFAVDTEASVVEWAGANLGGRHHGTLRFSGGTVGFADGEFRRMELTADLSTLRVGDLEGKLARILLDHLRSEDFFAAGRFPEATFVLESCEGIPGAPAGRPDHRCRGRLRVRDVEREIEFDAQVGVREGAPVLQARLVLDRTEFGATYGSGRLYHRLGMHLVNDEIELSVRVRTRVD